MTSRPPFPMLLTMTSLLFAIPTLASAEDDTAVRKKIVECINKDITAANSEWKLASADLKKFTNIIDRELLKEPLSKKSADEQARIINDIKQSTLKELPNLPDNTVEKMIDTLKAKGKHCTELIRSPKGQRVVR